MLLNVQSGGLLPTSKVQRTSSFHYHPSLTEEDAVPLREPLLYTPEFAETILFSDDLLDNEDGSTSNLWILNSILASLTASLALILYQTEALRSETGLLSQNFIGLCLCLYQITRRKIESFRNPENSNAVPISSISPSEWLVQVFLSLSLLGLLFCANLTVEFAAYAKRDLVEYT